MAGAAGWPARWIGASLAASLALVACGTSSHGDLTTDDGGGSGTSDDDSGAGTGSTTGSGTGSSTGSSGSGSSTGSTGSTSGSPTSGHDAGAHDAAVACGVQVPSTAILDDAGGIVCGGASCDLTVNTCCVAADATSMCVSGHSGCKGFGGNILGAAQFECDQITDCPSGQVCCGYLNSTSAGAKCQDVSGSGNKCTPAPTGMMGSVQFCQKTCECKDGSECLAQSCNTAPGVPPAKLTMCGLQFESPFNCAAQ
jgi:hypothetical protein